MSAAAKILVILLIGWFLLPAALLGVLVMASSHVDPCGGSDGSTIDGQQWTDEQTANARALVSVVQQRQLPQRAAVLAISTAIVESRLKNVHYGDRDSLGLFQQRPSQGWGSAETVMNPIAATQSFLNRLVALPGWEHMPPGQAQQKVQASAYPDRYAPAERDATGLVAKLWQPGPPDPTLAAASQMLGTSGCAGQDQSSVPLQKAGLPADFRLPADPRQRAAVEFALAQLGKPYVWGAKGPEAFDCSGLMQAAWAHAGVAISTSTTSQKNDGRPVGSLREIQPGDLVFIPGSLGSSSNPRHVGLYLGHGLIINSYDATTGVVVEPLQAWSPQIVMIRRVAEPIVPPAGSWGQL